MKTSPDRRLTADRREGGHAWMRTGLLSAVALGSAWLAVNRKSAAAERAHPPAGRFVEADGVRLHYLEQGQGPTLVLLHGNMTMADDFELSGLFGQLSRDFRVIAFDRPGFGYSERPRDRSWTPEAQARLLLSALDSLGAGDVLVVGHSWSTMVAVAMALHAPRQVRGLALLSGYYYPSLRVDAMLASMPALPWIGGVMRHTTSPLLGRMTWPLTLKGISSPGEVSESLRRLPPWMVLRPSQVRATAEEAQLMVASAARLRERYGELTMPVTILAGAGDRVADPEKQSAQLHRALPQSRLRTFEGRGHMLQHQAQQEIIEEILSLAAVAGLRSAPQSVAAQREQAAGTAPAAAVAPSPLPGTGSGTGTAAGSDTVAPGAAQGGQVSGADGAAPAAMDDAAPAAMDDVAPAASDGRARRRAARADTNAGTPPP